MKLHAIIDQPLLDNGRQIQKTVERVCALSTDVMRFVRF